MKTFKLLWNLSDTIGKAFYVFCAVWTAFWIVTPIVLVATSNWSLLAMFVAIYVLLKIGDSLGVEAAVASYMHPHMVRNQ